VVIARELTERWRTDCNIKTKLERTPIVGEVSADFCGQMAPRGQRDESLRPYSRLSRPEPLLFLPSSSSVVLTRLSGPHCRPTNFFPFSARESNPRLLDLYP
jgi:hypothetical protein